MPERELIRPQVWDWAVSHPTREVGEGRPSAGDRYYGAAHATLEHAAPDGAAAGANVGASMVDIMTEAYNAGQSGGKEDRELPAQRGGGAGDDIVGTTPLDTSRWGAAHVVLAVGPERGWTDAEKEELRAGGFELAGMGTRTLSTPTAALAAVTIAAEALR